MRRAMRASDSDRRRTVEELGRHFAAGRIDTDDYTRRIESALTASDLEELDELRADLPMMRVAAPEVSRSREISEQQASLGAYAFALVGVLAVVTVAIGLFGSWGWSLALLAGWLLGVGEATFFVLSRTRR